MLAAVALAATPTAIFIGSPGESSSAAGVAGSQTDTAAPGAGAAYLFR
jgi:hypothetical protein